jgi:hypothetical protein
MIKNYSDLQVNTRYSCPISTKLEFSGQNFVKHSNIKFHENPTRGRRVVPYGRAGGHDKTNYHFLQVCERA